MDLVTGRDGDLRCPIVKNQGTDDIVKGAAGAGEKPANGEEGDEDCDVQTECIQDTLNIRGC